MIKLGVNIDHVATLRQVRGTSYPSVVDAGLCCEQAGAAGITVHLREDRRHIQDADVYALRERLRIPLNLEMAVSPEIIAIALDVLPAEVCLVPEKRQELTTEGGLDVDGQFDAMVPVVRCLADAGIVVSLFIDPEPRQIAAAARLGVPVIELHTGTFCDADGHSAAAELVRLIRGAEQAAVAGLQVNAGHGINLDNIADILKIGHLDTLNIGHSIVARSVFVGMAAAVKEMNAAMQVSPPPSEGKVT
ncbi:MAG TPA: pyridoxine 5'-phosphate synthase [Verrucomicrobia bacterium]|nr:pyridoxine 5'-phosphate synthase [Verrucomicrobiota bacterium]